ncbi:unnamed protein product [Allacma fusca]|uniref:Uncharacterized protein n=1 Tax=Allacma fusca TaxID=39272 RepID=A0A8J2PAP6_9HEXA|nr:unnamed protein product [Allacma fusca]
MVEEEGFQRGSTGTVPFCEPAQRVFSIDLIVEKILSYLDELSDIKIFRLITPKCNLLALPSIVTKCFISERKLQDVALGHWGEFKGLLTEKSFDELQKCIQASNNFPCVSIKMTRSWSRSVHVPLKFYNYYGDNIQRLVISGDEIQFSELRILLLNRLRLLTILILENAVNWNQTLFTPRFLPESARLEHLKMLIVRSPMTPGNLIVTEDIILAAPKLEFLGGFDVELIDAVVRAKKTHLIDTLRFVPKPSNVEAFRKFSRMNLKLTTIQIPICIYDSDLPGFREESAEILSSLLESCKDTLENLQLTVGPYSNVKLPVLNKITTVRFKVILKMRYWLSDPAELSEKLPALETVIVDNSIAAELMNQPEVLQIFFEVMPSVKQLIIKAERVSKEFMEGLSYKFMNVETVKIHWSSLKRGTEFFWMLPRQVKRVEVWEFSLHNYRDLLLESFLTGIPRSVCKLLQKLSKDAVNLDVLIKMPSVRNLQRLEFLKFYCLDFPFGFQSDEFGFFSHLTKWFVVEHMPDLQLHMAFPQSLFFHQDFSNKTLKDFPEFDPISKHISISYWDQSRYHQNQDI